MSVQFITTSNGETLAILPKEEFDALVERLEDMIDAAEADRVLAAIAAGEEELLPAAFVERLHSGESRVRAWREYRGLSLRDLAAASGLSQPFLSQVENRKRAAKPDSLAAIAKALRIDAEDLADPMPAVPGADIGMD